MVLAHICTCTPRMTHVLLCAMDQIVFLRSLEFSFLVFTSCKAWSKLYTECLKVILYATIISTEKNIFFSWNNKIV